MANSFSCENCVSTSVRTLSAGVNPAFPAIVPGDSANSLLIRYVAGIDPDVVMPPEGDKLAPHEVGLLRAWIDQGGCVSGCRRGAIVGAIASCFRSLGFSTGSTAEGSADS